MTALLVLGAIAAGAQLLGGIFGAIGLSQQSQAQEQEAEAQAQLAEQTAAAERARAEEIAGQIRQETEWNVADLETQQRQFRGQQVALIGRSGVRVSSGSPAALLAETGRRQGEDVRRLRQQGEWTAQGVLEEAEMEAEGLLAQADIYRMQAESYRRMRPWQITTSLLGGFGSAASTLMHIV
jgi:hypothetical protein